MSILLYYVAVQLYHLGIRVAALWQPKARAWVVGRRGGLAALRAWRQTFPPDTPVLWMHCASLGEFEQGRPLMEELKAQNSNITHTASNRTATYGELAPSAAKAKTPKQPKLKSQEEFTIMGTSKPRFDIPAKVDGLNSTSFPSERVIIGFGFSPSAKRE